MVGRDRHSVGDMTASTTEGAGIVLAGGEGKRLMPLTADRAKPAVPFAGIYRLIDFALSNVVNSGDLQVVALTQYKSYSLDRHVTQTWRMSTMSATMPRRCWCSSGRTSSGTGSVTRTTSSLPAGR